MEEYKSQIPKYSDYSKNLFSKSFTVRQEQIQDLKLILLEIKDKLIIDENLRSLIRCLLNIISKEKCTILIPQAFDMLEIISNHLGEQFQTFAYQILVTILKSSPRLKSKLVQHFSDLFSKTCNPDDLLDDLLKLFAELNSFVLTETALFTKRYLLCFPNSFGGIPSKKISTILAKLVKLGDNSSALLRNASFSAISAFIVVFGAKVVNPHLSSLNRHKLKKISELAEIEGKLLKPDSIANDESILTTPVNSTGRLSHMDKEATPLLRKYGTKEVLPDNARKPLFSASFKDNTEHDAITRQIHGLTLSEPFRGDIILTKWDFDNPSKSHFSELHNYFEKYFSTNEAKILFSSETSVSHPLMFSLIKKETDLASPLHADAIFRWFILQLYTSSGDLMCNSFLHLENLINLLLHLDLPMTPDGIDMLFPHIVKKLFSAEFEFNRMRASAILRLLYRICDPNDVVVYFLKGLGSPNNNISNYCLKEMYFLVAYSSIDLTLLGEEYFYYFYELERLLDSEPTQYNATKFLIANLDFLSGENVIRFKPLFDKAVNFGLKIGVFEEIYKEGQDFTAFYRIQQLLSSLIHRSLIYETAVNIFDNIIADICHSDDIVKRFLRKLVSSLVLNILESARNCKEFYQNQMKFLLYIVSGGYIPSESPIFDKIFELKPLYTQNRDIDDKTLNSDPAHLLNSLLLASKE